MSQTFPSGPSCPIVPDLVDESAGRIAAFLSLGLLALAMGSGRGWAVLALAADFALRAAGRRSFSPVALAAGRLRRLAGLAERRVNAGPKRFAASVGLPLLPGHRVGPARWAATPGPGPGGHPGSLRGPGGLLRVLPGLPDPPLAALGPRQRRPVGTRPHQRPAA